MFRRILLAGVLCCAPLSFGQTVKAQANANGSTIIIAVDELACSVTSPGSFNALAFNFALSDSSGSGGAGAGRVTFSDLVVQKQFDACSAPLLVLAANGRFVNHVVLTEVNKNNKPILTVTLGTVQVSSYKLADSDSSNDVQEKVAFSYASIAVTDASGNTTGTINR
jgi:type VI protein secretion system component Hcp